MLQLDCIEFSFLIVSRTFHGDFPGHLICRLIGCSQVHSFSPHPRLDLSLLYHNGQLVWLGQDKNHNTVLICLSLVAKYAERFLTFLLDICHSFLCKLYDSYNL